MSFSLTRIRHICEVLKVLVRQLYVHKHEGVLYQLCINSQTGLIEVVPP